jgi:hypothetical protein
LEEIDIHPTGWQSQNLYFSMAKNRAAMGDKVYDEEWVKAFTSLGEHTGVKVQFQDNLILKEV